MRNLLLLFACSFVTQPCFAQLKGDSYATAKETNVANVVYAYAFSPGYVYKDKSGKLQGICIDIMDQFAKYLKTKDDIILNVVYADKNASNFGMFLEDVKTASGGVFGLSSTMISEERKKILKFSSKIHTTFSLIVSQKDIPDLKSISTIAQTFPKAKAYACKGTAWEKQLLEIKANQFPALSLKYIGSVNDIAKSVADDPGSFSVININYFLVAVRDGLAVKQHPFEKSSHVPVAIVMPLSSDWEPVLSGFLNDFVNPSNAAYRNIISKHLGASALKLLQ